RTPQRRGARERRAATSTAGAGGLTSWVLHHRVSHAAHSDDVVRAELLSPSVHEHLDRIALHLFAPRLQLVAQLLARQHRAGSFEQCVKKMKLARGERDVLSVARHASCSGIQRDAPMRNDRIGPPAAATEQGADARAQLVEVEWLDEIVIGTG